jgi:hypothetical protein
MRRVRDTARGAAAASAGVALVCTVLALSCGAAMADEWLPFSPPWEAASVAPGERSVGLFYEANSCGGSRNLTASATETRASVTVHVTEEYLEEEGGRVQSCPPPSATPLTVRLHHRLAGRAVLGGSPLRASAKAQDAAGRLVLLEGVPRLIGFSAADAVAALEFVGLRAQVVVRRRGHGRRRVVSQSLRPGRAVGPRTLVTVRVAAP